MVDAINELRMELTHCFMSKGERIAAKAELARLLAECDAHIEDLEKEPAG